MKGLKALTLLPYYLYWHYTQALKIGVTIFKNLEWFLWHFFSIGLLLRTLFTPFHRIQEPIGSVWKLNEFLASYTVNIIVRFAGALIRLSVIFTGLLFMVCLLIAGIIALVLWLLYPVIMVGSLIVGLVFLFKPL